MSTSVPAQAPREYKHAQAQARLRKYVDFHMGVPMRTRKQVAAADSTTTTTTTTTAAAAAAAAAGCGCSVVGWLFGRTAISSAHFPPNNPRPSAEQGIVNIHFKDFDER